MELPRKAPTDPGGRFAFEFEAAARPHGGFRSGTAIAVRNRFRIEMFTNL